MSEEIINLVKRQTNYDSEKARERLEHWKNDYVSVIKEYLNPDFLIPKPIKKITTNQRVMKELRDFYDGKVKS